MQTREFPNVWADLESDAKALIADGEDAREVWAWAESEYDAHCAEAHGEMYGPGPAVFDGDW